MNLLLEYILIFIQILIMSVFISGCGFVFKKIIFKIDERKLYEDNGLWGFLLISFLALLVNFFLPLTILINTTIFLILALIIWKLNFFNQSKKKLIKKSFLITSLSFILIIHSNVNMPDALLYHLPYSKLINENEILIGSVNLHHRFGHISIFQYISSFFYNIFFKHNGLLIPISLLTSFFLVSLYKQYRILFIKSSFRIVSYVIFLILIISIYSFSRYSNFGNDSQVHIYYFLLFAYILQNNFDYKDNVVLKKISLIALFTFLLKPFYFFSLLIPLGILIVNKNYKIFFLSLSFLFASFISFIWFLKNVLITGCLIYPIVFTCFKNLSWTAVIDIKRQNLLGEAMSKGWQSRFDKSILMKDYINNFNWLHAWFDVHANIVFEKSIPVLIFLFVNIVFFYVFKTFKINKINKVNTVALIFLSSSFLGSLVWFLKFPTYRYGHSYLYSLLLIIIYIFIFTKFDVLRLFNIKKYLNIIIIISACGLLIKNLNRINNKIDDPIMPHLFDNINHKNISIKIFNDEGIFTHFIKKDGSLCGYSQSPCANGKPKINIKEIIGFKVYYKQKK
jgi:hypothetical protein